MTKGNQIIPVSLSSLKSKSLCWKSLKSNARICLASRWPPKSWPWKQFRCTRFQQLRAKIRTCLKISKKIFPSSNCRSPLNSQIWLMFSNNQRLTTNPMIVKFRSLVTKIRRVDRRTLCNNAPKKRLRNLILTSLTFKHIVDFPLRVKPIRKEEKIFKRQISCLIKK